MFAFDIYSDLGAIFVQERIAFPDSVCATASSLLVSGHQHLPAVPNDAQGDGVRR
jgi:hypothetical protein